MAEFQPPPLINPYSSVFICVHLRLINRSCGGQCRTLLKPYPYSSVFICVHLRLINRSCGGQCRTLLKPYPYSSVFICVHLRFLIHHSPEANKTVGVRRNSCASCLRDWIPIGGCSGRSDENVHYDESVSIITSCHWH